MPPGSRHRVLIGAVLIASAAALAYVPSLRGDFILDDTLILTDNTLIKASDGLYRFWNILDSHDAWPLTNTTLWLEWRLWGMHSAGYHVTNLGLHIVEALLIWAILSRLSIPGAFMGALLFAVHPVNVESVAWIAQRKTLLAMLFFLLSIFFYLKAETALSPHSGPSPQLGPSPQPGPSAQPLNRWYWLSLSAGVLAMLSKGSVVVLPIILLGIMAWMRPLTRQDVVRVAPFVLASIVLVVINIDFQAPFTADVPQHGLVERVLGAGAVVWFYLYKALLPVQLCFAYPRWDIEADQLRWWLPLVAALVVTRILWGNRGSWGRPLLFAWAYFCIALVPVMGFTDITYMEYSLVADHYQHVALIGVTAVVAAGWSTWQRRAGERARRMLDRGAVALVGVLIVLTWRQSSLYADNVTLYQATLKSNPDSWMIHNNLGAALFDTGRFSDAIEEDEWALRLKPDYPEAHNNLANALRKSGRLPEAIEHYEEALRLRPTYAEAHNNLGGALASTGQLEEAIGHFQQALYLRPDYPEAEHNLAIAVAMEDDAARRAGEAGDPSQP